MKELLVVIPSTGQIVDVFVESLRLSRKSRNLSTTSSSFHFRLKSCDDQLVQSGGISSAAWEILDNADNVVDARAMVCDGGLEFQGMDDHRPALFISSRCCHRTVIYPKEKT
ncbi:hypothetical protein L917_17213 [Phytophthora nicotianae]|uniref:Uncharacterized protein n=3 Tax=Phytophthora nicotianae TaxID=4792 RepID=W2R2F1_PHYN3|nr:hypothetical protein PPTG_21614 [Phytophthora nicotianae INRA-310]ETL82672.1 hypothetical protein L917_17213 [Phytophthora nicotianae]ETN18874.1 hypothetical protein PPTG_21614 [Phytophthora nicotianae INRA-310]ETO64436.1 hypothetical protein F444_17991 [Phytophthora nicotianae P1976]